MGVAGVNITIGANTEKFKSQMAKAQASVSKFGKSTVNLNRKLKKLGKSFASAGRQMSASLTLPILAIGGLAVKTFADFEQSMAKVAAVSGATGAEFQKLEQLAKDLGASTRFTAAEVAELQLNYSKLGFVPAEIQKIAGATLNLALATGEDLAQSAEVAGATLRGLGLQAADMPKVVDIMAASFSSTALDLESFQEAMKLVAPTAVATGRDMETVTAQLGVLANNGIKGSIAGTQLNRVFIELNKKGLSLEEALDKVSNSSNGLATATGLVKDRGAKALLILAKQRDALGPLEQKLRNAEGAAAGMAAIMDDTLQGAMLRVKSAVEGAAIELGDTLAPVIKKVGEFVAELANKFSNLSPKTKKIIAVVAGLAAAIGPLLVVLGFLISTILPALVTGFALLTGPIGLVVVAIGIAAFEIQRNWDDIVDYFTTGPAAEAWLEFQELTEKVFGTLPDSMGTSSEMITKIWDQFVASFIRPIKFGFETILRIVKTTMGVFGDYIDIGTAIIAGDWATVWNEMKSILIRIFDGMVSGVTAGISLILGAVGGLVSFFNEDWADSLAKAQETVNSFGKDLIEGAGDFIGYKREVKAATKEVDELADALEDIKGDVVTPPGGGGPTGTTGGGAVTDPFKGMGAGGEMSKVTTELMMYEAELANAAASSARFREQADAVAGAIAGSFEAMGTKIAESFISAETAGGRFLQGIAKTAIKLIAMALGTSIANSIAGATASGAATGPAAIFTTPAFIATAIGGVLGAFAAIPKFAQGGLAFGETLGIIGEGRGTSRSNPEVIAPLDKLQSMIGGSGGGVTEFVLRGETLRAVTNKVADNRSFTVRE